MTITLLRYLMVLSGGMALGMAMWITKIYVQGWFTSRPRRSYAYIHVWIASIGLTLVQAGDIVAVGMRPPPADLVPYIIPLLSFNTIGSWFLIVAQVIIVRRVNRRVDADRK